MGRSTYYAPTLIGIVFAILARDIYADMISPEPAARYWGIVAGCSLAFGLICQLAMLGAQGVFAQVLPAPGGKSIRGRGATVAGWFALLTIALGAIGGLLIKEAVLPWGWVFAGVGGASALAALITYAWNYPTAVADFGIDRRYES